MTDIYLPTTLRYESESPIRLLSDPFNYMWNHSLINVRDAHEKGFYGKGIKIGILDTGLREAGHDGFNLSNVMRADSFVRGENAIDDNGHQTNVQSIIGNKLLSHVPGILPESRLYIAKCLDKYGNGRRNELIHATENLIDMGVHIINASLSFGSSKVVDEYRKVIEKGVKKGVLFIFSSGNRGANESDFPSNEPNVICVGAVDVNQKRAVFSNQSMDVDCVAPGVNILGCHHKKDTWVNMSGTSQAAPHVTGIMGLYFSKFFNMFQKYPNFEQSYQIMKDNCTDLGLKGQDASYGFGLLKWNNDYSFDFMSKGDVQVLDCKKQVRESLTGIRKEIFDIITK